MQPEHSVFVSDLVIRVAEGNLEVELVGCVRVHGSVEQKYAKQIFF